MKRKSKQKKKMQNSLLMVNPALLLNRNRPQQCFRRLPRGMSRQLAEMMEMHRKQQLMAKQKLHEVYFHLIHHLLQNPAN
jgi:hypothetical protein